MSGVDTPDGWRHRIAVHSDLDATDRTGEPATAIEYRVDAERTVRLLGETLSRLHAVELHDAEPAAPMTPAVVGAAAAAGLRAGSLVAVRGDAYAHLGQERLVEVLVEAAPAAADRSGSPVLTHGAPCLANLRCDLGSAVGFVAWEAAAPADRHRDLAVAARSVAEDLTPVLVPVLFEHYRGPRPDPILLDWWSLAAELLVARVPAPG